MESFICDHYLLCKFIGGNSECSSLHDNRLSVHKYLDKEHFCPNGRINPDFCGLWPRPLRMDWLTQY